MCCLFGLIDYGHRLTGRQKGQLIRALAVESEARGTDAAGVAYNSGGKLHICKRPGPAHKLNLFVPEDAHVVMGHSRMTTQGRAKFNRNNHPFAGKVPGTKFALAHNGVLYNDMTLRRSRALPDTRIETDSYVAVQLIEQQRALTPASLKTMAEAVEGSFVFTVLDEQDNFYFVKGDNPLCLLQFPSLGLYVYASTEAILRMALNGLWLNREPSKKIAVDGGEILWITPDGARLSEHFAWEGICFSGWYFNRRGARLCVPHASRVERQYLRQLKNIAASFGYGGEEIDAMLADGWTTDEIEEMLYDCGGEDLTCLY